MVTNSWYFYIIIAQVASVAFSRANITGPSILIEFSNKITSYIKQIRFQIGSLVIYLLAAATLAS